jgi:hypothetical protein
MRSAALHRGRRVGRPKTGNVKQLIAIRIAPPLLARPRRLAAKQSKPYQTLIHELLEHTAGIYGVDRLPQVHTRIRNFSANVLPCSVIYYDNSRSAQGMNQPKPSTPGFASRTHRRTQVTRHSQIITARKPSNCQFSLIHAPDNFARSQGAPPHRSSSNTEPSTITSQQTLSNRNKIAFKIPPNSMKINAEPNLNRNKNRSAPSFTPHRPRTTNRGLGSHQSPLATHQSVFRPRGSRVADHQSRITNHESRP